MLTATLESGATPHFSPTSHLHVTCNPDWAFYLCNVSINEVGVVIRIYLVDIPARNREVHDAYPNPMFWLLTEPTFTFARGDDGSTPTLIYVTLTRVVEQQAYKRDGAS